MLKINNLRIIRYECTLIEKRINNMEMILNSLVVIASCCGFLYWIFNQFSSSIKKDIQRLSSNMEEFKNDLKDQRKRTDQLFEILINNLLK